MGGDGGLDGLQGVVLDALFLLLGGATDLELHADLLGGGLGWVVADGQLVPADGWGHALRQSWGSPAEEHHVQWVLVDLDELNERPEVNEPGLSLDLGLQADAEVLAEGVGQLLDWGSRLDGLGVWRHGHWDQAVDLLVDGVWHDVVVEHVNWAVGSWSWLDED